MKGVQGNTGGSIPSSVFVLIVLMAARIPIAIARPG
jgi:hypothetical protein